MSDYDTSSCISATRYCIISAKAEVKLNTQAGAANRVLGGYVGEEAATMHTSGNEPKSKFYSGSISFSTQRKTYTELSARWYVNMQIEKCCEIWGRDITWGVGVRSFGEIY